MATPSLKGSSIVKTDMASSHFEIDNGNDQYLRKQAKIVAMLDAVRIAITTLALLAGLTILGLAGNTLAVYNSTRLQETSWLSLWPADLDLRPTVALVVGSSLVTLANIAGLVCSKMPLVSESLHFLEPHNIFFHSRRHGWLTNRPSTPDPQEQPPPHTNDVRRTSARLHSRAHRHHLLLRRQRLHHHRHPAQLDLPLAVRLHDCRAPLWVTMPLELGIGRAGRRAGPAGGCGAVCGRMAAQD